MRIKSKLRVEAVVEVGVQLLVRLGGWSDKMKVISYPTLVSVEVTTCPDRWVGGWWVVGFMIIMLYSTQFML